MKVLILYIILFLVLTTRLIAQDEILQNDEMEVNSSEKYFEDQFYIGLTYNLLVNRPSKISQNNFSNGIQLGFIKDVPFNERCNVGAGIGIGLATNSYYSSLRALKQDNEIIYDRLTDDISYRRNMIETYVVEMPIEIRWRTSTIDSYRFWRIYAGVKFGYAFSARSKFITKENKLKFNNDDIDKFQYGAYLSFGYNTWNFYGYYQLNSLLKDSSVQATGETIKMAPLHVCVMFYIL